MAGNGAVLDLRRPLADHDRGIDDAPLPAGIASAVRLASGPPLPQSRDQLAAQPTASLHLERLVDGFVHDVPFPLTGELGW